MKILKMSIQDIVIVLSFRFGIFLGVLGIIQLAGPMYEHNIVWMFLGTLGIIQLTGPMHEHYIVWISEMDGCPSSLRIA